MAKKQRQQETTAATAEGLQIQVHTLEKEIFALRQELAFNKKLDKPHLLKQKRKDKARALTSLAQLQRKA